MRNVEDTPFQILVAQERLSIADAQRFKKWAKAYGLDVHGLNAETLSSIYGQWNRGVAGTPETLRVAQ